MKDIILGTLEVQAVRSRLEVRILQSVPQLSGTVFLGHPFFGPFLVDLVMSLEKKSSMLDSTSGVRYLNLLEHTRLCQPMESKNPLFWASNTSQICSSWNQKLQILRTRTLWEEMFNGKI